ncbi:sugar diacid recognition domain-containing protein [Pseudomonas aeruginosa]|uniref:sugar diacid recognition domain-containing protein n=1 Tax=Pseudomonas aeruginosa TaxID=287 RepID=UPI00104DD7A3|nr:sugar diacid recognition domain-containing protein [Pseudomonas aeruginosa]
MFELDSTLAQHIVDRAMAILPHNINVMDAQGMIIGSGDPSRLHTRHEGAQLVLANRRVVEIDEQAAACLRGVRPGVNLPLLHAERLVGVLGITGAPEVVRPYAELVRMAAEMLMEQRQMQDERHWQRQRHEAWLRQLLDPGHGLGALAADAEHLGLAMHWPRQAVFLDLLDYARSRLPGRRVVTLDGHRLASLLFSQRDSWQVRQLLAPLQRLLDHDPQGSLAATLESWCAHDGHAQACAQALGIHRNSLRYRLERIASISGLDLARLEHRQQLLLGLQLLVPRRG